MVRKFFTIILLFFYVASPGQQISIEKKIQQPNIPYLNYVYNRIITGNLDDFYKKLSELKRSGAGVVTIVHVGDSHIQPDFFSSVLRNNLQAFFGNAGRGLVFPYQLAKSNAPSDIVSNSNAGWQYNRLAHPEIPLECGISGFCIKSGQPLSRISLSLKDNENGVQTFDRIQFFTDTLASWQLQTDSAITIQQRNLNDSNIIFKKILLKVPASSFSLISDSNTTAQSFYGVSLEKNSPGLLLHTIGVNGARYQQYNNSKLFWQQLSALNADLIIVSLGTNEAQEAIFNEEDFLMQVSSFIEKAKAACPGTAILITTPQDSYKGNKSNDIMRRLNISLAAYCRTKNIALWDLYKLTNGYGSARTWYRKGLLNKDRIHFNAAWYKTAGKLLFNALAEGYNSYIGPGQNFK